MQIFWLTAGFVAGISTIWFQITFSSFISTALVFRTIPIYFTSIYPSHLLPTFFVVKVASISGNSSPKKKKNDICLYFICIWAGIIQLLNSLSTDSNSTLWSLSCKTDMDNFKYPLILLILSDSGFANPIHTLCRA